MKMNRHATSVPALATAGLLAACGDGGSGGDPAHFSGRNDSMATRISGASTLEEATTFKAKTAGINHVFDDGVHDLADSEDIALQVFRTSPNAVPTFVVTYNGETATFGPEQWEANEDTPRSYFVEGQGDTDEKWLWTPLGSPLETADGRYWGDWTEGRYIPLEWKYHVAVALHYGGDPASMRRNAVIGLETAPGDMPTHGIRARYRGRAYVATYNDGERQDYRGDVTLFADFSEGTIGGVMDEGTDSHMGTISGSFELP